MLDRLSFVEKWCSWIKACVTTTFFATMLNEGPSGFFKASRRLRQGDPLFPLLFIVVVEALNKLLARAMEADFFRGLCVGKQEGRVEVTHLFLPMIPFYSLIGLYTISSAC